MRRVILAVFAALLLSVSTFRASGQTAQEPQSRATSESSQPARGAEGPQRKDDLQKMRVILNQMRTNLAFVGNTTTPLAHQFQLEIDMWQALLDQMERRQSTQAPSQSPR